MLWCVGLDDILYYTNNVFWVHCCRMFAVLIIIIQLKWEMKRMFIWRIRICSNRNCKWIQINWMNFDIYRNSSLLVESKLWERCNWRFYLITLEFVLSSNVLLLYYFIFLFFFFTNQGRWNLTFPTVTYNCLIVFSSFET